MKPKSCTDFDNILVRDDTCQEDTANQTCIEPTFRLRGLSPHSGGFTKEEEEVLDEIFSPDDEVYLDAIKSILTKHSS